MRMLQKQKSKINKALSELDNYHDGIPIDKLNDILKKNGYMLVQEDGTPFEAIFCGDNANTLIDIGIMDSEKDGMYEKLDNSMLYVSWYKMPSGRYEINTYLT